MIYISIETSAYSHTITIYNTSMYGSSIENEILVSK